MSDLSPEPRKTLKWHPQFEEIKDFHSSTIHDRSQSAGVITHVQCHICHLVPNLPDYHDKSMAAARESAKRAGVADRVTFEVSKAKNFPGKDYDFVAVFDCLHDRGEPVGAAAHVRQWLAMDGTWMIVEPFANDQLKDNPNPVGRVYYSFSTLLRTPCSRSQEVGLCLGAQAGETRIREV